MVEYKYLTQEQRDHFLKHGWLRIPNAINKKYLDAWMADCWTRLDYNGNDPSTWKEDYVMLPRHREVHVSEFCPDAWKAMCEIVGGIDRIDPVRNSHHGDQLIINAGSEYWETHDFPPQEAEGWHTDNDWYRQFLDSGSIALTIIHLFTDIEPRGGGTFVCEDGIKGVCEYLYNHPDGIDPPYPPEIYKHLKQCTDFKEITGNAGDTFITHVFLPHSASKNHTRKPRVITNPHVTLKEPFSFDRENPQDYSLVEQLILDRLGKKSIPPSEWHITRDRMFWYPRNYTYKIARMQEELERMIKAAEAKGLGLDSVDSIYLKSEKEIEEHYKRQGLDKPHGPYKFPEGTRRYTKMEIIRDGQPQPTI